MIRVLDILQHRTTSHVPIIINQRDRHLLEAKRIVKGVAAAKNKSINPTGGSNPRPSDGRYIDVDVRVGCSTELS